MRPARSLVLLAVPVPGLSGCANPARSAGQRCSTLDAIDSDNVDRLGLGWTCDMAEGGESLSIGEVTATATAASPLS